VVPGQHVVQGAMFGVGLGVTAYALGMRHAFEADRIAAIDNTTRKLVAEDSGRGSSPGSGTSIWVISVTSWLVYSWRRGRSR
jgi:high-affinity nickel-transport protein